MQAEWKRIVFPSGDQEGLPSSASAPLSPFVVRAYARMPSAFTTQIGHEHSSPELLQRPMTRTNAIRFPSGDQLGTAFQLSRTGYRISCRLPLPSAFITQSLPIWNSGPFLTYTILRPSGDQAGSPAHDSAPFAEPARRRRPLPSAWTT